jgi:hypothetical protein
MCALDADDDGDEALALAEGDALDEGAALAVAELPDGDGMALASM